MNEYFNDIKTYVTAHKAEFLIGIAVTCFIAGVISIVGLIWYNSIPKVVYQPTKACDLLTIAEARELMGGNTIHSNNDDPKVNKNVAVSRCGYTDGNAMQGQMTVAAIIVRSGVNDDGVEQNKNEFAAGWPSKGTETVNNIGDRAYYSQERGQLNILKDRDWIILSYGLGSAPDTNTLEKAMELARKVVK